MMSRLRCALVLFACALAFPGGLDARAHGSGAPDAYLRVAIPLDDFASQIPELRESLADLYEVSRKQQEAYAIVSELELERLKALGYAPRLLEDMSPSADSTEALSDYVSPGESKAIMDDAVANYPEIAQGLQYGELTQEGRTVHGIKISDNVASDEAEPRIFFVSQHHAREVMTPEVMVDMVEYLTQNYGLDDEVTRWVDEYEIYIIPTHNPDGTEYVFAGNTSWRKNRRDNGDGSFGVDPNRNYPYAWGPDGCNGSDGDPSSLTYRGPSAASEPITRSITDLVREIRPSISLTYHTTGELVLQPLGCSPNLPDDPDLIAHREVGSMLAAVIENDAGDGWYEMGTPYEVLYSVDGGSDDWLHAVGGTVAFTIEMNTGSNGFQPDYATWRDDTVTRNRAGWQWLLRRLDMGAVQGVARDACSDAPLAAEVGVAEQLFTLGQEPRTGDPDNGFFHRVLEPAEYTWYGELEGYRRQEWPLSVAWTPVRRDLWLVPSGSHAVELRAFGVDDASGDNDGQLDPGEELLLIPEAYATGEGVTGLSATLASSDPYLEILDADATLPDLAAGGEGAALDAFRVRVLEDAPDGHVASVTVSFAANEILCRASNDASLRVTRGFPALPFEEETLDTDPLWTIEGPAEGWEFGAPQGNGSTTGPAGAFTGDNVYGTNLDGNYGTTAGDFVLTTAPFDLQGLRDGELRYQRWLRNEAAYDLARIEVSIDEQDWTEIWRGFGRDVRWEEMRHDLPDFVDGAEQAWIRFVMRQDGGGTQFGWFLDDVRIVGENALTAGGRLKFESYRIVENDPVYGNADGALDAGETVTLPVTLRSTRNATAEGVSAILSTATPGVVIHNAVADYADIAAGSSGESLAPHFTFSAGPDCAARIAFELEVRAADGSSSTSRFTVPVGTLAPATLFVDDMELDRGWTTESPGPDGQWELGDPHGNTDGSELTNPEDDHGPDPDVSAWVTSSVPPPTSVPPTVAEVDGTQILVSPRLAAQAFETLQLTYWRWFYTGGGPGPDLLRTEVSGDGGLSWRSVDEVGTKANEWTQESHDISATLEFTDDFFVRFVAIDAGGESIVEAGVDDLELAGEAWFCDDVTLDPLDAPNPLGPTLTVTKRNFDVRLAWQAPPEDATHGPATYYSVTRSLAPADGFAEVGKPSAERYVDVGVAGPSDGETYFYVVVPENNGGSASP